MDTAAGKLSLSSLDRELKSLPLLDRTLPFLGGGDESTKEWVLHEHVYPIIRDWGVHIGTPATPRTVRTRSGSSAKGARIPNGPRPRKRRA